MRANVSRGSFEEVLLALVFAKQIESGRKQNYKDQNREEESQARWENQGKFQTRWMFPPMIPLTRPQGPGFWPATPGKPFSHGES